VLRSWAQRRNATSLAPDRTLRAKLSMRQFGIGRGVKRTSNVRTSFRSVLAPRFRRFVLFGSASPALLGDCGAPG
jgi:hypothetical protein